MNYFNGMYGMQMQPNLDRINRQIEDLQNLKTQMQNPPQMMNNQTPAINQTFQLSNPQNTSNDFDGIYVNNIDEVKNTLALRNTLFVNKEMSTLWFKDASGNIKTYTLTEIIELDEKDKQIIELQKQIEELKGVVLNAKSDNVNVNESITRKKPSNVSSNKSSTK